MMLLKCCTLYASKVAKLSSGHRTKTGRFSFQYQRKAMPKSVETTTRLHSFHILESNAQNSPSQASIVCEPRTSRCSNWMQKMQRNQRSRADILWIIEQAREFQKNMYFCFITVLKPVTLWITTNWKILRDGNASPHDLPPEKPVCRSRSNTQNLTWNDGLVPDWERGVLRLYIISLLI